MIKALAGAAGLAVIAGLGCAHAPHPRSMDIPQARHSYDIPELSADNPAVLYVMDKVDNYQTVIMGENHAVETDELFVAGLIPHLKQHNADLALEISRTYQPEMDAYLATGILPNDPDAFIPWVYKSEKGVILKSARNSQVKIWCIDASEDVILIDLARDIAMYDLVKENILDKGKKMVAFIGLGHISETEYEEDNGMGRYLIQTLAGMLDEETNGGSFSLLFDSPIWSISHALYLNSQIGIGMDFDGTEIGLLPAPADICGEYTTMEQCFDGVVFVPSMHW